MEDLQKKCNSYCLRLVSMRDYSEFKLQAKLREKGYPLEVATHSIDEMKRFGYIKEEQYRQSKIKMRLRQGKGARFIREELKQEKIAVSETNIEEALTDLNQSEDEILRNLLERKTRNIELKNLDYEAKAKIERKIISSLFRNGYDFGKIKKMLDLIFTEENNHLN